MKNKFGKFFALAKRAQLPGPQEKCAPVRHMKAKAEVAPNRPNELMEDTMVDYNHFINDFSNRREPSVIRELSKLYSNSSPDTISFAGGLPHPSTFPFEEISARLSDGSSVTLSGKCLQDSLQYIPSQGYPRLVEKLRQLQWKVHAPPQWENLDILVTPGSQDGLCKSVEMSLEEGEPILVQHPVYSGTESLIKPYKAKIIPIEQDQDGLRPDLLRQELEKRHTPKELFTKKKGVPKHFLRSWKIAEPDAAKVFVVGAEILGSPGTWFDRVGDTENLAGGEKFDRALREREFSEEYQNFGLLYINSTGANPTGVALTTERKKEIYRIACEYNLLILEDDPYYYLHFQDKYPTSFLSLDTEGRVIRFDSFSKIISAGLRVGFVTGPKQLVKRIELHLQASSLHAPALSQVLIDKILEKWGFDGLFKHFEFIQNFYRTKRDALIKSAEKHLTGLAEWNVPTAGMFLWIKVKDIPDTYELVTKECLKQGVLFVTGHAYSVNYGQPCPYLRASYTLPTFEQMDTGMKRLADAIRDEQEKHRRFNSAGS